MTPPPRIPGYTCLGLLGEGGMGRVYRARQEGLDREVALKLLHPELATPDAHRRFLREAQVMASVRHPHLIELYDAGTTPRGAPWIAMERIEGISLQGRLDADGPASAAESLAIMLQVADALDALHALELIHRDVKPANIMLEAEGRAVLMDLGIARRAGRSELTGTGLVLGTPVYMAPELLQGAEPDPLDDWYAWGVTWWQLLSGRAPFTTEEALERARAGSPLSLPAPRTTGGGLGATERALLSRATGPRATRPVGAGEIREFLRVEPPTPASTRRVAPAALAPGPSPPTRRLRIAPVQALALVLLAGLLGWSLRRAPGPPPPPAPSSGPEPAPALRIDGLRRSGGEVLLRVLGAPSGSLRAYRTDRGGFEPVPAYELSETRAWVWLTGLEPGRGGQLLLETTDGTRGMRVRLPDSDTPAGDRAPRPPWFLRSYLPDRADPTARREAEEFLAWLREVFPEHGPRVEEALVLLEGVRGRHVPDAAWPGVLDLLSRDVARTDNLLRAFQLWQVRAPEPVAWQLLHLLAGWTSRRWLPGAWAARVRVLALALRGRRAPAALTGMLSDWLRRNPPSSGGVHAIALWMAHPREEEPEPFGFRVPGWTVPDPGAPPRPLGLGPLEELIRRVRGGRTLAPADLRDLEGPIRLFALALIGGSPEGLRHGPWLVERYRAGAPPEARAADAALEALQYPQGDVWTCGPAGTLWFWGVPDREVSDLHVEPRGTAAHRLDPGRIWVYVPGHLARVRWREQPDGSVREQEISCN